MGGRKSCLPPGSLCPGLVGFGKQSTQRRCALVGQISASVQVGSPFQGCVLGELQPWYYKEVNE